MLDKCRQDYLGSTSIHGTLQAVSPPSFRAGYWDMPCPDSPGPRALHTHDGHRDEGFSHSTREQLLGSALLARSLNVKQFGCQMSVFKLSVIIPQKCVPTWRSSSPRGAFSDSAEIAGKTFAHGWKSAVKRQRGRYRGVQLWDEAGGA